MKRYKVRIVLNGMGSVTIVHARCTAEADRLVRAQYPSAQIDWIFEDR